MAFQFLINLIITFVWMFLYSSWDLSTFIVGFLVGMIILFIVRRFFPGPLYVTKIYAVIKLTLLFMKELILSNITVVKQVLQPKLQIKPGIFALETELESDWEIVLLSLLITLTPGTLVVDVSEDQKTLFIHAMNIDNIDESISSIKNTFEKAILEVSR
ncbi:Na+/H+ antiporter subunit E [Bacillus suaedae]|uniref:Na+/H+ antiporter subunit E n=1 Tax=Halalkalibacter suaedae TaxID=2822140 RepID=A0A940WVG0_9BACI|nr:Na+/H+ antiporter subunit E [Bacillus suaedae]MBP3951347.1 Na+/H+ antiporter subunit E [Bacillus suaedae]